MMNRDELLELIPTYVLGALEYDERMIVEAFIETDVEAQQLVQEYEDVASILPLAAPIRSAPSHLRTDLRQRLAQAQNQENRSDETPETPSRVIPYRILLSAAAAIIIVLLGWIVFLAPSREPDLPHGLILYNEISAQAGFQRFEVVPTEAENVTGELVVSADGSQAVLRIAELPMIEENQRYQLWMAREDSVESGGLFYWRTGHGPYYIILPVERPLEEYVRFGMSIEPEDGSPYPDAPSGSRLFSVVTFQSS